MPAQRRVLIAGAGDLGTRIAANLRARGCEVVAIARRPRPADASVLALDLARPLGDRIADHFDLLVHCLAPAVRDEAGYRAVYLDALQHLLDALPGLRRIAFVSSTAVYGDHGGGVVDEDSPCRPQRFNGRVLLDAEALARRSGREALALRLGGLYGPGRDLLPQRLRSGEPLAVSEPPQFSNRIHIEDAAAAVAHLLLCGDRGIFNLVDDDPAAQPEVLDWLADAMRLPRLPKTVVSAAAENKRVSNARLRATGFQLRFSDFRAGYASILSVTRE
ncbi:MAG: NAD-dependent epimerase/dehydratase family protein [Xanthomonadales bacterium]|nr:NAD-dependent epimerase/dehydratase family protein [Xanthomonadales bacterium]